MNRLNSIKIQKSRRKDRVRSKINGTNERPRLSVFVSNRHITAQIIDDLEGKTLVYESTVGKKNNKGKNMTLLAAEVGSEIAKKAKLVKISNVILDRGSHLYHGRVKALADAAREGGLEF